jgi:hypothetical protein
LGSARQTQAFAQAIANHRRLEELLHQMRQLSEIALLGSAPGVKKRRQRINPKGDQPTIKRLMANKLFFDLPLNSHRAFYKLLFLNGFDNSAAPKIACFKRADYRGCRVVLIPWRRIGRTNSHVAFRTLVGI